MSPSVPLSVIYGGQSWITSLSKEELATARGNHGYTNVYVRFVSCRLITIIILCSIDSGNVDERPTPL